MDPFQKHRGLIGRRQPSNIDKCSRTRQTDINKKVHPSVDCQTLTKLVPHISKMLPNISVKLCTNSNQTLLSNTLTFARSHGSCWKPRPSASVFNTSLEVWQALMHEKPCLIHILYASLLTLIPGCLRSGLSWFNWWVSFPPEFQCCYIFESSSLFYLSFNSDFYVFKIMHLWARNLPRKPNN